VQVPRGSQDKLHRFLVEVISALNKTMYGVHEVLGILCRYVDSIKVDFIKDSDIQTMGPYPSRDSHTVVSNESFTKKRERKMELDQFGPGRWNRNNDG
jgi:hypothetical protein